MSIKNQLIIFMIIVVIVILFAKNYWDNNEIKNYISSGDFKTDLEILTYNSSSHSAEVIKSEFISLYDLRNYMLKKGIFKGFNTTVHKELFTNFKLIKTGKDCYVYEFNIIPYLSKNIIFISFKGNAMKDYMSKNKCSKLVCNIYFTEKGLLQLNQNYLCK